MSQVVLAERVGFSQPDISKVERCERRLDVLELFDFIHAISGGDEELKKEIWDSINECCNRSRTGRANITQCD